MRRFRHAPAILLFATLILPTACSKKAAETETGTNTNTASVADPKAEAEARLKEIGKAMVEFEKSMKQYPAGYVGPKGEFGLSWRVQILPFLGPNEAKLFEQFNTKEPWDSETNKKLVARMPKVFASPGKEAPEGKTYLRSFVGEHAFIRIPIRVVRTAKDKMAGPFPNLQPGAFVPCQIHSIPDGTVNTLAVVEATEPVEWTKPDELSVRGGLAGLKPRALPKIGGVFEGGFHAILCYGGVRFLPDTLKEETLRALISTDGNETLPADVSALLWTDELKKPAPAPQPPPGKGGKKVGYDK